MVPGRGRIRRQGDHIGLIGAWVELGRVGREVEVEDLRQQDHAVEVRVAAGGQVGRHRRRARRAVAFAEQVFGAVPAAVAAQEALDELGEGVGVRVDAVEALLLVAPGHPAETRARRVDEHKVGGVQQAVGVLHQPIGGGGGVGVVGGHHPARAEGAHVQPHGRGARPAVVQEGDRPVRRGRALGEIGDVEHRSLGLGVGLVAQVLVVAGGACGPGGAGRAFARGRVVPALGVDHQRARHRPVVDPPPAHRHRARAFRLLGSEDHALVGGGGGRGVGLGGVRPRLGRGLGSAGGDRQGERQAGGGQEPFRSHRCSLRARPGALRRA